MYGVFFSYEKFKGGAATLWQELIFLYDKERKMNQALDIVKALIISYLLVTIVIFFVWFWCSNLSLKKDLISQPLSRAKFEFKIFQRPTPYLC